MMPELAREIWLIGAGVLLVLCVLAVPVYHGYTGRAASAFPFWCLFSILWPGVVALGIVLVAWVLLEALGDWASRKFGGRT